MSIRSEFPDRSWQQSGSVRLVKILFVFAFPNQSACGLDTDNSAALFLPPFPADRVTVEISEHEENDDFLAAQPIGALSDTIIKIKGSQRSATDIDVYSVQRVRNTGGMKISLNVASDRNQALQVCLFDSQFNLLRRQGLHSIASTRAVDAFVPPRDDLQDVFIAISAWAIDMAEKEAVTPLDYTVLVQESGSSTSADPRGKRVWLAFGGAHDLGLPESSLLGIRSFDPAKISGRLSGSTPLVIESLISDLRLIFGDYDIEFQVYENGTFAGGEDIIALIGGSNSEMNGTTRSVGFPDGSTRTAVLVFAENLASLEQFVFSPQQAARYLANVVAHELGHVIGLDHTIEPEDAMSIFQTAIRRFNDLGTFGRATLLPSISRIGFQDGRARLLAAVGPSLR